MSITPFNSFLINPVIEGKIGVNTSNPAAQIEVAGDPSNIPNIYSTGYGATNPSFIGRRANGTMSSPTAILPTSTIVSFGAIGYGATAFSSSSRGYMRVVAGEFWTDAAQGTYIEFGTTNSGTTSTATKIRIDQYGLAKLSKTINSTNALTAITLTTQNTYLTGTAGASLVVTLPAANFLMDGAMLYVMSTASRSTVSFLSSGASFVGDQNSLDINTPVGFQYDHATLTWYRTH